MDQSPRAVILVVLLLFIFLSPDPASVTQLSHSDVERLEEYKRRDFDIIANSTYGSFDGLNLTGFRLEDGYQWSLLPVARLLAKQQSEIWDGSGALYQRMNGDLNGNFVKLDITRDASRSVNFSSLMGEETWVRSFQKNVTEKKGKIKLILEDSHSLQDVKDIKATMTIYTESSPGNGWDTALRGLHFANGSVVLATSSRKFNSLPAFPQLTLDERQFDSSRMPINQTVARLWAELPNADIQAPGLPSCEVIIWLQQLPLTATQRYIDLVEDELGHPDGAPIGVSPLLTASAVVFSPDCGYVLQASILYGPKDEVYWNIMRRLLSAFALIICLQILLLKRQMEKCVTPSTRSRISYYTIGIAALGDGLMLFGLVGLFMIDGHAFSLLAAAAFLCTMHVAFFEVKFIYDIWTVQVGDPAEAERARQRRAPANQGELPLPAIARTEGAAPTMTPEVIETPRANFASLYSKFYFGLVNLMFLSLWAITWPLALRSAYFNVLAFFYFSLWFPQIFRNVMRNCRKALNWEYVLGSSVLRAVPVTYWYLDDRNIAAARTDPSTALFLLGWLWIQVIILVSQQYLGPRLLVKDSWCPEAYDYHPVLYDDLEARGMPIGELASASEGKDKDNKTRKVFDCAICMNEIDVPVISKDENSGRSWLEQRNYMVTPCRHIFHTECLEGWMNLRLVCPVCREGLPPL